MENNDVLIEYILGGLSEVERERIEEQYFVNNEIWEKLRAVEDDLIDCYVRGELPPQQREQFEKYFLASPNKRRRVEFARTLMNPAARESVAEEAQGWWKSQSLFWRNWRPSVRLAVTAAGLALAVTAAFFLIQNVGLRRELRQSRSKEIELRNEIQTLQQPARGLSGIEAELLPSQVPKVSMLLTPGLLRNGKNGPQNHILPVPAVPFEVVLLLSLESDEYPQYDVVLRTAEGREIRRLEGLMSQPLRHGDRVVAIHLPGQLFPRGDYIATLSGRSAKGKSQIIDSYTFSVAR